MYDVEAARKWNKNKVYILDTETTGLYKNDEVLSLSIVNFNGVTLFDELIKPAHRYNWKVAQSIHGISPDDVKDKRLLTDYEDELKPYFGKGSLIVGYNIDFDRKMLLQSGAKFECEFFDVMKTFAQGGTLVKLVECAKHYGYRDFAAHGSLEDAKATAFCFGCLLNDTSIYSLSDDDADKATHRTKKPKTTYGAWVHADGTVTDLHEDEEDDDEAETRLQNIEEYVALLEDEKKRQKQKQEDSAGCYVFLVIIIFFAIGFFIIL